MWLNTSTANSATRRPSVPTPSPFDATTPTRTFGAVAVAQTTRTGVSGRATQMAVYGPSTRCLRTRRSTRPHTTLCSGQSPRREVRPSFHWRPRSAVGRRSFSRMWLAVSGTDSRSSPTVVFGRLTISWALPTSSRDSRPLVWIVLPTARSSRTSSPVVRRTASAWRRGVHGRSSRREASSRDRVTPATCASAG